MKVNSIDHITGIYNKQTSGVSKSKSIESKKDVFLVSEQAKEIQSAFKLAKQVPDIRAEKVDYLKNQIQTGTYNVKAEEVAEKILSSFDIKG